MRYSPYQNYNLPERTASNPDPVDINKLTENWTKTDTLVKDLDDAGAATNAALATHIADNSNPHNVTASQVGAYTSDEVDTIVGGFVDHLTNFNNPHQTTASQIGAYTAAETNSLLDGKASLGEGPLGENLVVITNADGNIVASVITSGQLETLAGINGNIQEQLNNISFYNYLSPAPLITLSTGGDDFPEQSAIDGEVIPVIEALYPNPSAHDAVIQNVQTQNTTARRAILYSFFDGTQSDGFIGWRWITNIDTLINLASGTVNGVVRSSDDIDFQAGLGTVLHSALADEAELSHLFASNQLGVGDYPSTDLNTYYGIDGNAFFFAGSGNTVTNKPANVDAFLLFVLRGAAGYTLQALYCSTATVTTAVGLWYRQWDGSAWSEWISLAGRYLRTTGGALTGNLDMGNNNITGINEFSAATGYVESDPTEDTHVANKKYVDGVMADAPYLPLTGGTVTGPLTVNGTITATAYASTEESIQLEPAGETGQAVVITEEAVYPKQAIPPMDLGTSDRPWQQGIFGGDVQASSFTLNGDTITSWPSGSGGSDIDLTNIGSDVLPAANNLYSLGSQARRWKDAYISGDIDVVGEGRFTDGIVTQGNSTFNGDIVLSDGGLSAQAGTLRDVLNQPDSLVNKEYVDSKAGGKKYATAVVGTALAGYAAKDVDYLCTGTNDQLIINQALAMASKVVLLDGVYNINGAGIEIYDSGVTLEGMGYSTQLVSGGGNMYTVNLGGVNYVTVSNLAIFPETGAGTGVYVQSCSYITLSNLIIVDAGDTGIFTQDSSLLSIDNSTVRIQSNGQRSGFGINMLGATGSTITGCKIENAGEGVRVSGGTANTVKGCYARYCRIGIVTYQTVGTAITGNTVEECDGQCIGVGASQSCTVSGNACNMSIGGNGIAVYNTASSYNVISGNTCTSCGTGIYIPWHNNTCTGNICTGCNTGIYIVGSGNTVTGNLCTQSQFGISVATNGTGSCVVGNNAINNSLADIQNTSGASSLVANNVVTSGPMPAMGSISYAPLDGQE